MASDDAPLIPSTPASLAGLSFSEILLRTNLIGTNALDPTLLESVAPADHIAFQPNGMARVDSPFSGITFVPYSFIPKSEKHAILNLTFSEDDRRIEYRLEFRPDRPVKVDAQVYRQATNLVAKYSARWTPLNVPLPDDSTPPSKPSLSPSVSVRVTPGSIVLITSEDDQNIETILYRVDDGPWQEAEIVSEDINPESGAESVVAKFRMPSFSDDLLLDLKYRVQVDVRAIDHANNISKNRRTRFRVRRAP